MQAEVLKRTSPDDEAMVKQADWYLKWCERYTEGEMFARSVQFWDEDMGETPTFWFTTDEAMERARQASFEDESNALLGRIRRMLIQSWALIKNN